MSTEFNDSQHYGFFMTGTTLTSSTGKYIRVSELVLAALRAQGVLDNMVDSTTPPATDKLWLDKNTDPAVLKEWDATGSAWTPITFARLFGRAIVTVMATPTGTANALVVAAPSPFIPNRMYSLTPVADNAAGSVTIQVTGIGTYPVKYTNGNDLDAQEFKTGNPTILLFTGSRFEVVFKLADMYAAVAGINIKNVATRTELKALNTAVTTLVFLREDGREGLFEWTTGNYSTQIAADTREGVYIKADAVASSSGAWVRVDRYVVNPLMFGALRGRANASTATAAIQAMIDYCGREGAAFDLLGGNWFTNSTLMFREPVTGYGRGRGYWHPKPPTAADGVATVAATQIILTGTGPRTHTVHGISSMAVSGGVITNPSASLGNDGTYGLTSFENSVATASGRSRKAFSAGMWFEPGAAGSKISGFRVVPDGDGDDGINKYITAGAAGDAWAADWDVGIVIEMANQMVLKDVEAVGHFRMMGELLLAIPANPADSAIPALWGVVHENVQTSGWRATEVRGADAFRCVAVGADYIEVPWADDHPFDPSAFTSIGYGTGTFSLTGTKTFSSISKQGSNLRLSGITTPADISVGNHIYARIAGGGTSHCRWDSACKFTGMHHQSGNVCHSSSLGGNAMARPGAGFVASGWRMTELEVLGALQGIEEIGIHVHALSKSDIFLDMEGSGSKPLRIIASPTEASNTRVTNPAGRTQFTSIDSRRELVNESGIDARPILDSATASAAYPSDSGFFEMTSGRVNSVDFTKADGTAAFEYDRTNARNSHGAHIFPSADNAYDDGSSSFRKRSDFARNQFFGSGTARLTGRAGTPVGNEGGNTGSICVDETAGKAYIKPTSSGSSDWRELPQILTGSTTWDPASLADGAGASQNVTVTGAVLGDFCVPSFSLNIQGMLLTAHVTSADTVTVRLQNETGGAIDLGSGTLRVVVIKQ